MGAASLIPVCGLTLAVFLTVFLMTKEHRQPGDLAAIAYLWLLASPAAFRLCLPLLDLSGKLSFAKELIPLAFGPALYLYTARLVTQSSRKRPARFLHYLPFVIVVAIFASPLVTVERRAVEREQGRAGQALSPPRPEIQALGLAPPRQPPVPDMQAHKPPFLNMAQFLVALSFAAYAALTFRLLKKHRGRFMEYFSFANSEVNLSWLGALVLAFALIHAYMLIALVLSLEGLRHPLLNPLVSMDLGYGAFVALFGYFALRQERVFYRYGYLEARLAEESMAAARQCPPPAMAETADPGEAQVDAPLPEAQEGPRYSKSTLDEHRLERYFGKIDSLVRQGLFQKSDLTMEDVAERTGISRHYISQTINRRTGGNFFAYVNGIRVEAVIKAFSGAGAADRSILELACEAGFNSKSSFINHFKKTTGETPRDYRSRLAMPASDSRPAG